MTFMIVTFENIFNILKMSLGNFLDSMTAIKHAI